MSNSLILQKLIFDAITKRRKEKEAGESAKDAHRTVANRDQEADPEEIKEARGQLLEAMALYNLRNTVVNSVLITNPILKGIHDSTYASPVEQDMLPWVRERDAVSHDVSHNATALRQLLDQLTEMESDTLRACRQNRELAAELLRLAGETDRDRAGASVDDTAVQEQIKNLETRLAASRQKWRVMKGTASGIVAGSGVDWVNDEELRDVVLDPE